MFTYIKFEDGVKAIVNTDDIVDFDVQSVQFDKKYQVKWDDGHFYYGILGKMQQKIILEETKEAVDEKVKSRRVEFAPLNLCISATEIDTESDFECGNSFKDESLKNRCAIKIKKINMELEEKENTNNATTSDIVNETNTKKTKLKDIKFNINKVSEKKEKQKENIKNQKQQNGINKPLVIAKNVTSSKQSISKIKETNKQCEFKLGKAENCTQDGKSDNTEFVSCTEIVAPNKKEIISLATNTKRVHQLCSTMKLIDCSIVDNNIATSITKNQSYTNKKASETKFLHKTHENNHIPAEFKHKIKETLSKKNNNAQSQPKTNQDDILKKKIEKLRKTNENLETKNMKLKNQIRDKERIIDDLMSLNMQLQKNVIDEYPKLHQINEEIGKKVLNNFDELMHLMSEYFKRHPMNHEDRVGDLPIGYRNIERNEVHLGYGIYICARQYDAACVISKTLPQFVKNLAVAVFGIKTLKESSVTGARSNRNRNKTQEAPRPALDSTKLQALRAIVKHYAMSERGQDEIVADYEAQQIGTHIAHKIYELNHPPNRNKIQHKKVVPVAQVCEVMNNSEKTSDIDDPEKNSVPNNENFNASSPSHSVTEVSNNNASKEHGSFESLLSDNNTENECHKDETLSDKDEKESTVSSVHGTSNTSIDGTDNESD